MVVASLHSRTGVIQRRPVGRHMSTVVALSSIPLDWTLGTLITLVVMQLPVLFWVWLTQSKDE